VGGKTDALSRAAQRELFALLRGGHFRDARSLLAEHDDPASLIERARLAFFLDNDLQESHRLSLLAAESDDATIAQKLLARIFLRCVDASLGIYCGPAIDLADLAGIDSSLIAELIYYAAYASYFAEDFTTAETWITSHNPTASEWCARYLILRGLIAGTRGDFAVQATLTLQALDVLETSLPDATYLIANASRLIAMINRDIADEAIAARLQSVLGSIGNDDGFTGSRFHIVRSLAWTHALRGLYSDSMGFVLQALGEAENDFQRLYAYLDHAAVAVFAGEQRSSTALAAYKAARQLLDSIPWGSITSDDIVALPLAAQIASEFGAADDARRYCELALASRGQIAARLSMAHDGRYDAFVQEAVALSYPGADRKRAIAAAADAYETYKRIGFEWRAARMAILLLQLTHVETWRARAKTHLTSYPDGPFHRLLDRPRTLTKRQEDVLRLIRLGMNDSSIARELGISSKTVRIHLGHLFRFYAVKSRSALMAKAASAS